MFSQIWEMVFPQSYGRFFLGENISKNTEKEILTNNKSNISYGYLTNVQNPSKYFEIFLNRKFFSTK